MSKAQYKVISGVNAAELQKQLDSAAGGSWKPILLTSAATNSGGVIIVAVLEQRASV